MPELELARAKISGKAITLYRNPQDLPLFISSQFAEAGFKIGFMSGFAVPGIRLP